MAGCPVQDHGSRIQTAGGVDHKCSRIRTDPLEVSIVALIKYLNIHYHNQNMDPIPFLLSRILRYLENRVSLREIENTAESSINCIVYNDFTHPVIVCIGKGGDSLYGV